MAELSVSCLNHCENIYYFFCFQQLQTPGLAREFVENHLIPELTDDTIKEICQLEHPKFMLQQLNPGVNLMAKYDFLYAKLIVSLCIYLVLLV